MPEQVDRAPSPLADHLDTLPRPAAWTPFRDYELIRLTVEECLSGVTSEAARALGLAAEVGTLEVGKRCDLAIWDVERPAELVYRMGFNPLHARVWRGQ